MAEKKSLNSIDNFIRFQNYQRASQSENPTEKCKDCSFLFVFKGKTRCYVYEQQRFKDKMEFHPRRDFNCSLFDDTGACAESIFYYQKALANRDDPLNDTEYQKALKEENDYYETIRITEQKFRSRQDLDNDEWDDPNTYARCSDWEDEPENCYCCADDECPMNKG